MRFLLGSSTDPDPVDRWGGTPLSDAEADGHVDVVDLLRAAAPSQSGLPRSHREVAV